jgi:hypothetical protein
MILHTVLAIASIFLVSATIYLIHGYRVKLKEANLLYDTVKNFADESGKTILKLSKDKADLAKTVTNLQMKVESLLQNAETDGPSLPKKQGRPTKNSAK